MHRLEQWMDKKSNALCMSCFYKLNCEEIKKKIFYCTTPFCEGWTQREIFRRRHKHTSKELKNYRIHQLIQFDALMPQKRSSTKAWYLLDWQKVSCNHDELIRFYQFLLYWGIQWSSKNKINSIWLCAGRKCC